MKLLQLSIVDFDITNQLLIRFMYLSDTGEEMGVQWDNTWRDVLYNIPTPMKLFGPIKMCLNKTYSKVHTDKIFV
jgi:hypothetical protein